MDDASEHVAPGDGAGPRARRQGHRALLPETLMRAPLIEEGDILAQDPVQVALAEDQQVVQALLAR
jgi:hypothetical protein